MARLYRREEDYMQHLRKRKDPSSFFFLSRVLAVISAPQQQHARLVLLPAKVSLLPGVGQIGRAWAHLGSAISVDTCYVLLLYTAMGLFVLEFRAVSLCVLFIIFMASVSGMIIL